MKLFGDCVLDRRLDRDLLLVFVLEFGQVLCHVHLAMFQVV